MQVSFGHSDAVLHPTPPHHYCAYMIPHASVEWLWLLILCTMCMYSEEQSDGGYNKARREEENTIPTEQSAH